MHAELGGAEDDELAEPTCPSPVANVRGGRGGRGGVGREGWDLQQLLKTGADSESPKKQLLVARLTREPTPLIRFKKRVTGARAPAIKKGSDPIFAEALSSSA